MVLAVIVLFILITLMFDWAERSKGSCLWVSLVHVRYESAADTVRWIYYVLRSNSSWKFITLDVDTDISTAQSWFLLPIEQLRAKSTIHQKPELYKVYYISYSFYLLMKSKSKR